jgi:hypothetical protein
MCVLCCLCHLCSPERLDEPKICVRAVAAFVLTFFVVAAFLLAFGFLPILVPPPSDENNAEH